MQAGHFRGKTDRGEDGMRKTTNPKGVSPWGYCNAGAAELAARKLQKL